MVVEWGVGKCVVCWVLKDRPQRSLISSLPKSFTKRTSRRITKITRQTTMVIQQQRCLKLLSLAWVIIHPIAAFVTLEVPCRSQTSTLTVALFADVAAGGGDDDDDEHDDVDSDADGASVSSSTTTTTLSYQDSDGASKGLVGGLTALVNSLSSPPSVGSTLSSTTDINTTSSSTVNAPSSSQELLERLRNDYTERNYLWTGDLDLDCFTDDCRFTDPTLTFIGTKKFRENTQNLVPVVTALVSLEKAQSVLLSIEDRPHEGYVTTRWNMVGTLDRNPLLFWKPKIDVIGRTKFWYKKRNDEDDDDDDKAVRVYFYDEEWEISAYQALLQLITPAGTISNARK